MLAVVAFGLGLTALLGCSGPAQDLPSGAPAEVPSADAGPAGGAPAQDRPADPGAAQGREAGELAGGTLPLSGSDHPAISRLQPDLRDAVERAAADAGKAGVEMWLTSGWRSKAYQQTLFDAAVGKYGSSDEALRHVATPENSAHVRGAAVDIGPTDADDWLIRKGARYGLCQAYANEMWHFELLTEPGGTCPAPLPDASGLEG